MRTFVISDIHGDLTGFTDVYLAMVFSGMDLNQDRIVFLGDYVDGYSESAGVIKTIRRLEETYPEGHVITLRGNHEQLLIDGWNQPKHYPTFQIWFRQGGEATANSYGLTKNFTREYRLQGTPEFLDDLNWMKQLPYRFEDENYHYVHAGFRPGVKLEDQDEFDMLWIREEFIDSDYDFGKPVVFGHTAVEAPVVTENKIQMDTRFRGYGFVSGAELFADRSPTFYQGK